MSNVQFDASAWLDDAVNSPQMKQLLTDLALQVVADTEPLTPVDTGLLKASWWTVTPVKHANPYMGGKTTWAAVIGDRAFYASYVEFGTRHNHARLMLHNGAKLNNVIWPKDQEPYVPPYEGPYRGKRRRR